MYKMRIISYNVNGTCWIYFLAAASKPDVICLQEIKATPEQIPLLDFD
jgi:exodeoxyribonuclease-3